MRHVSENAQIVWIIFGHFGYLRAEAVDYRDSKVLHDNGRLNQLLGIVSSNENAKTANPTDGFSSALLRTTSGHSGHALQIAAVGLQARTLINVGLLQRVP